MDAMTDSPTRPAAEHTPAAAESTTAAAESTPVSAVTPAPLSDPADGLLGADQLRPVSERLIPARYLASLVLYAIGLALTGAAVWGWLATDWWWLGALGLVPLLLVLQSLVFTPRRVRALGYRDDEDHLTVADGIMFRTVQTIPYGRVQSVKIDEGPIARKYGLATLELTTAANGTVTVSGLPREEAERLRALLSERGVELMAAL